MEKEKYVKPTIEVISEEEYDDIGAVNFYLRMHCDD